MKGDEILGRRKFPYRGVGDIKNSHLYNVGKNDFWVRKMRSPSNAGKKQEKKIEIFKNCPASFGKYFCFDKRIFRSKEIFGIAKEELGLKSHD